MSKDPAVLFYTSDFLSGTAFFTYEQRGQYITLLCEQHQLGHIPDQHMLDVCQSYDSPVFKKFIKDENGNWYNKRMDEEFQKRRNYCESRRKSRQIGIEKQKKKQRTSQRTSPTTSGRMENENENTNTNINKNIYNDIISHLNKIAGTKYKSTSKETQRLIDARLNSGFTKDDFIIVINNMEFWLKDEKMMDYYRPQTLFGTKFESYLNKKTNGYSGNSLTDHNRRVLNEC